MGTINTITIKYNTTTSGESWADRCVEMRVRCEQPGGCALENAARTFPQNTFTAEQVFPWPVSRLRTVVGSPLVIWLADWPATSRPDHSVTEEETFIFFLTRPLYFLAVQQELHSHRALSGHSLYVIVVHLCVRSHTHRCTTSHTGHFP